ncbi:antibiotic biosynthesis monooxygenase [Chryseobacterium sp. 09-1422]|uniref:Antibiotic biosynthesis monooxygenase n=1 Tax=Chryseobacterium kimseyorum TaxID=2984028 RepID=A0ABT3HZ44_9FLAO|nr:putative quinol monooxygenase [Chryseobacterium kimseyorum]MCW3169038.1 antibiotic biosynthesis monooxygenase [Chryseobacterium kimseyorum]
MSEQAIYVYAQWNVKVGKLDEVLQILTQAAKKSSEEKGNLFYKIHQSKSDQNTLILFEGYENETALEFHKNSENYQNLVVKEIVPLLESREVILMDQVF